MGIDSTFIRTRIRESGKYRRQKTENGIKMHSASITFPFTLPVESVVTPANLNDSPEFDEIFSSMDQDLLGESILTFDLGYYDLEMFRGLKNRNIMFVTRIKRNARYEIIREIIHVCRSNHGFNGQGEWKYYGGTVHLDPVLRFLPPVFLFPFRLNPMLWSACPIFA